MFEIAGGIYLAVIALVATWVCIVLLIGIVSALLDR